MSVLRSVYTCALPPGSKPERLSSLLRSSFVLLMTIVLEACSRAMARVVDLLDSTR